ncbi:MAG: CAP domain-containing protein [Candidatus Berkelbacteria bacterium]
MTHAKYNLTKIFLSLLFGVFCVLSLSTTVLAASSDRLIELTNQARVKNNLPVLNFNQELTNAAQAKAQDMFKENYFAHISPSGKKPWNFIEQAGYQYAYAGENLAMGYSDDSELQEAWMNSATHKENILSPNFNEIGLAVVDGKIDNVKTTIVVEMFGAKEDLAKPAVLGVNSQINAKIENSSVIKEFQPIVDQKILMYLIFWLIGCLLMLVYFTIKPLKLSKLAK